MRWNPKPKPELDSWRIVKRFAWLPVLVNLPSKQYVWLEFYKVNQQYKKRQYFGGFCDKWLDRTTAVKEYWSQE